MRCTLGADVGTSSTKCVLVLADSTYPAASVHHVRQYSAGRIEMDAALWWDDCVEIARERRAAPRGHEVTDVDVSGIRRRHLLAEANCEPLRLAILYSVVTRASAQIEQISASLGVDEITRVRGSLLNSQVGGPKFARVAVEEPDARVCSHCLFALATRLPRKLTDTHVFDHQAVSLLFTFYGIEIDCGQAASCCRYATAMAQRRLALLGDIAVAAPPQSSRLDGIRAGNPVLTGTFVAFVEVVTDAIAPDTDVRMAYDVVLDRYVCRCTATEGRRSRTHPRVARRRPMAAAFPPVSTTTHGDPS